MRGFDRGPYALSRKSKNAPAGLYMPPDVRLVYNALTSLYWLPQAASSVGGPPSTSHRDVVAYWRRKAIHFPPIDELPGAAASQGGRFNLQTTYKLLLANGGDSGSGMGASTLYYVYVNPDGFVRASATAYAYSWEGVRILGRSGSARDWLYIGMVYMDASTNFVDSASNRLVANYFNRRPRSLKITEATDSWTYTTDAWRSWNNSTANRVNLVANGEDVVFLDFHALAYNGTVNTRYAVGIGIDSATVNSADVNQGGIAPAGPCAISALYASIAGEGFHFLQLLERSQALGTTTFYGDDGGTSGIQHGAIGWVIG